MTSEKAKELLLLYRGRPEEALDPDISAALRFAESDTALKDWLNSHLAFQRAMRGKLREIKVPERFKKDLLTKRNIVVPVAPVLTWWRQPTFLSAAAIVVLLGALVLLFQETPRTPDRLAHYQSRMIGTALRQYRMDILTNDMRQVRAFMARKGAPAHYEIPNGLERLQLTGGGALKWRGNPVTMVCFDRGDSQMLYLFVMKKEALKDPPPQTPQTFEISDLAAASWSEGDKIYLLAGLAEPDFPRKYIQ